MSGDPRAYELWLSSANDPAGRCTAMPAAFHPAEATPGEPWYKALKSAAMVLGIGGAAATAAGSAWVVYGFGLFLASSLIWAGVAVRQRETSLLAMQACFIVVDVIGLWRWR